MNSKAANYPRAEQIRKTEGRLDCADALRWVRRLRLVRHTSRETEASSELTSRATTARAKSRSGTPAKPTVPLKTTTRPAWAFRWLRKSNHLWRLRESRSD
jgi:hypothetical protein